MKSFLRFSFAAATTLAAVVVGGCMTSGGTSQAFKGPVGLQLYSLRAQFATNVPATLDEVQKWNIKYAELAGTYKIAPADFRRQLLAHDITPVSGHFSYDQFRDHLDDVLREAKELDLKYVGCAWIPHLGIFTEKNCRDAAAVFNHAGEVLAKNGIQFFYHTHGYEFQPYGDGTLFDLLMKETKPKYVHYEMDIFWIVFPGQDPVKLLGKYKGRWALMHLKDMKKGLATGSLIGGTDVRNDVALGTGQMDMPAILCAAKCAGVKWYFIEDESPDSEAQIPVSLNYLAHVPFSPDQCSCMGSCKD